MGLAVFQEGRIGLRMSSLRWLKRKALLEWQAIAVCCHHDSRGRVLRPGVVVAWAEGKTLLHFVAVPKGRMKTPVFT